MQLVNGTALEGLSPNPLLDDGISLLLGIALSAACGIRVFVPFLAIAALGVLGGWDLPEGLAWLDTSQALILFAAASTVEVGAYYLPQLDNLLSTAAIPLAVVAGTLATAALVSPEVSPILQWAVAAIAGGGSAGIIKGLTGLSRLGSAATTGGLANPFLAALELIAAIALTILAIALPIAGGVLVLGLLGYGLLSLGSVFRLKKVLASLRDETGGIAGRQAPTSSRKEDREVEREEIAELEPDRSLQKIFRPNRCRRYRGSTRRDRHLLRRPHRFVRSRRSPRQLGNELGRSLRHP